MSRKLVNGELKFDTVARRLDDWVDHHPWARGGWVPADQEWHEFMTSHRYRPKDNDGVTPIQPGAVRDYWLGGGVAGFGPAQDRGRDRHGNLRWITFSLVVDVRSGHHH